MNQPVPGTMQYKELINDIECGRIKIPQFQRQFVWSKIDSAKLLDSVIKGYPIGTFIIWKTREILRSIRNIGRLTLPEPPEGELIQYVLDGQQRITSLYVGITGAKVIDEDEKITDYSELYVDLEAKDDGEIITTDVDESRLGTFIRVTELIKGGLSLAKKYDEKYHGKLEIYADRFKTYIFSTITVQDAPIDVATEIFTRLNIGGKRLSVFEIMVAKTYDAKRNFDLSEKFDTLIEHLETIGYETISNSAVLQAVSVCLVKECTTKHILKLDRTAFIDAWGKVTDAIETAAEYFRTYYRIPVSQLLPYDGLIVPFAYYFYNHKDKPEAKQEKYLRDYFWRVLLNSRFSSGLEGKIAQDIERIDRILACELPTYDVGVDISTVAIERNGYFRVGTAYIKGLLCLLTYQQPKSFRDNAIVVVDNSWLKQANSKNYHHFFPRAYLYKRGKDDFYVNHIANITIVDDFLNKREIKDKAPSLYMKKYVDSNESIDESMISHLIGSLDDFGIWDDDYDSFFKKRLELFSRELKKRIIPTEKDILKRIEEAVNE